MGRDETLSPELVKEARRQIGRLGGLARSAKYSKEQIKQWGRKGGRPRKDKIK